VPTLAIALLQQHSGHQWTEEHKFHKTRQWRFDYACAITKISDIKIAEFHLIGLFDREFERDHPGIFVLVFCPGDVLCPGCAENRSVIRDQDVFKRFVAGIVRDGIISAAELRRDFAG